MFRYAARAFSRSFKKVSLNTQGFTLVELLVVISIIALLTGAVIPSFSNYIKNQNLRQAQEQFKSDLRTTQNKALTGTGTDTTVKYWGIHLLDGNNNYYTFSSTTNTAACPATFDLGSKPSEWLTYTKSDNLTAGATVDINGTNACLYFSNDTSATTFITSNFQTCTGSLSITSSPAPNNFTCMNVTLNGNSKQIGINSQGLIRTN